MAEETAGFLIWVSPEEQALIRALRDDPDQERHIVQYDGEVTVRHPISERVTGTLFDCPALQDATDAILADDSLLPGRYRMSDEIPGELEAI